MSAPSSGLQRGGKTPADGLIHRVNAERLEAALAEELTRLSGRVIGSGTLAQVVRRVDLRQDETHLLLDPAGLGRIDQGDALAQFCNRLQPGEAATMERGSLRVVLRRRMRLHGGRTSLAGGKLTSAHGEAKTRWSQALQAGHRALLELEASPMTPSVQLRRARAPATHYRRQQAKLAFLAPDLQRMILQGAIPEHLELNQLLKGALPNAWSDQRALFGLNGPA